MWMMNDDQSYFLQSDLIEAEVYLEESINFRLAGDYENSVNAVTRAIQLSPANANYRFQRASTHFMHGHYEEAIADYSKVLELEPDSNEIGIWDFTIAKIYLNRGTAYRYRGDYDSALADFTELIRLQPNDAHHYVKRSVVYKLQGDFEKAFADLETLHRLAPDDSNYLMLVADIQIRQGNKIAALRSYDEQIIRFGTSASYFYRGRLWNEQGNLSKAIADFEKAIEIYPQHYAASIELSKSYIANGDFMKAIDVLNEVLKGGPGYDYIAYLLRARAYRALGNSDQASKDFDEAIRANTEAMAKYPPFTQGYAIRGHAYAAQGQIAEAVADYKMALASDPIHSESVTMHDYILMNS